MVKVAKKYTTAFRPLLFNDETKCALPVWHCIEVKKKEKASPTTTRGPNAKEKTMK